MAIKSPKFNLSKFGNKILSAAKHHTVSIWVIFGFLLLLCASYIFYYQIYMPSSETLSPTIQLPVAQKGQLDQILKDLDAREKRQQESSTRQILSPFVPLQ